MNGDTLFLDQVNMENNYKTIQILPCRRLDKYDM